MRRDSEQVSFLLCGDLKKDRLKYRTTRFYLREGSS
jgi:hypothetical protein